MAQIQLHHKKFFFHSKNQKQALCIKRKKLLLATSYPGKLNQSRKHSPKDTFCMFTFVKRGLWQLRKIFSNFPRRRHLLVRTQKFRITNMTKYLSKITNNSTSKKPLTAQTNCSKSAIKTQNQELKSVQSVLPSAVLTVISYLALLFLLLL